MTKYEPPTCPTLNQLERRIAEQEKTISRMNDKMQWVETARDAAESEMVKLQVSLKAAKQRGDRILTHEEVSPGEFKILIDDVLRIIEQQTQLSPHVTAQRAILELILNH